MATYDHFYDMLVYQKCRLFKKNISKIVKTHFPKSEQYHLRVQILDSSKLQQTLLKDLADFITWKIFSFADNQEDL